MAELAATGAASPADELCVAFVTAPDATAADALARALVEERLAACVNVLPGIRSVYRWEGALQDDAELLLTIKTRRALCERLAARVVELHPYDVPEVIALPVVGGSADYLRWVQHETGSDPTEPENPA